ncbi:MAG: type II toxin-antitoxin system VapC family toxin [Gammaproteobacteria bacterium]
MVVDASVLTDFLLGRAPATDALRLELAESEHEPLHAPELIEPETLNALRRLVRAGHLTDQRATEAAADLESARLVR